MLAAVMLWMRLLLGGDVCLLTVDDWLGPELPNRAHGPAAVDDHGTGLACHVVTW
jgi:hypothetical protein